MVHRCIRTIDALGFATTLNYDALNQLVSVQDPSGGIATTVYDAAGNVQVSIDPLGHRTTFTMDALNRVVQINDAIGGLTTTVYDAASNVQAIVDPDGNRTTYANRGTSYLSRSKTRLK